MSEKEYRYEQKYILSPGDAAVLKRQIALVCTRDPHSVCQDYSYDIRSLYFDDPLCSALNDKINGEMFRKKYRIRLYNGNTSVIKLECKYKDYNMTYKSEQQISLFVAKALAKGEYHKVRARGGLLEQFLVDARLYGLKPSVVVDYRRLAFVYPVSNVRITFDENIRSGRYSLDIFDSGLCTFAADNPGHVELEVKCSEFIPEHIKAILESVDKCRVALSKFALASALK